MLSDFLSFNFASYFGEYPLFFAACTNQPYLVEYLVKQGADLNAIDSNGNTILHLMVLHNLPKMYDFIENLWKNSLNQGTTLLWKRTNCDNLTPLTLAASTGNKDMLSHLIEKGREVQWSYGPVTCVLYPLEELDTLFNEDGRKGALECIVEKVFC